MLHLSGATSKHLAAVESIHWNLAPGS